MKLALGNGLRLEVDLAGVVAASAVLVGVILCRRGLDDLLRAGAARLRPCGS